VSKEPEITSIIGSFTKITECLAELTARQHELAEVLDGLMTIASITGLAVVDLCNHAHLPVPPVLATMNTGIGQQVRDVYPSHPTGGDPSTQPG